MAEEPDDALPRNKPEGDREQDRDRLSDSPDDEVVNRSRWCTTPRRYEQPIEDDDDPNP